MHAVDLLTSVSAIIIPRSWLRSQVTGPQGESTASNLTTLNFQTSGGSMKIEADTSAARATHYSVFDRTPAGIDNPDLAGDLDHLAASRDYLDCLTSAQK